LKVESMRRPAMPQSDIGIMQEHVGQNFVQKPWSKGNALQRDSTRARARASARCLRRKISTPEN
jgi:hypothetical protein